MAIIGPTARKPTIDLSGPDGNVFCLIGQAQNLGRQLGWPKADITAIRTAMMSADYENAIQVFDHHFGDFVDLIRPPSQEDDA